MHRSLPLAVLLVATTTAAAPATWMTPETAPWRVPVSLASDIAIVDAQRAVVITSTEMMVVDRKTGAVSAPVKVTDGTLERVAKVGTRLLAFGQQGDRAAIWELSTSPPSAKPLTIDDLGGEPTARSKSIANVRVSPDHTKIAICSRTRSPTIRDAKTLRVLHVAKGHECIRIRWSDNDHVAIGRSTEEKVIEVATGKLVLDDEPKHTAGPRGVRLAATSRSAAFSNATTTLRTLDRDLEFADIRWSSDGAYALALDTTELAILETRAKGRDRIVPVPSGYLRFAVDDREALVLGDHAILAIDLATGTVRQSSDTVSAILQVAVANGTVLAVSDALRVWRDGTLVRRGPPTTAVAPGEPIATLGDHLTWWSADNTLHQVGPEGSWSLLSLAGPNVLYSDGRRALAARGTAAPTPWLTALPDREIIALDAKHGRVALRGPKAFEVGTPAKQWAVQIPDHASACGSSGKVGFSPDGKHFVIGGGGALHLFDGAARKRLGRIELDTLTYGAWDFLPTGELVLAGVDEIVIVDLTARRAIGWKPPHGDLPVAIGVGTDELAVGYHDGRLLWTSLAEVRKGAARPVRIVPSNACR